MRYATFHGTLISLCLMAGRVFCEGQISTEKMWYTNDLEPRSVRELYDEHSINKLYDIKAEIMTTWDIHMINVATMNFKNQSPKLDKTFMEKITAMVTGHDLRILCLQNISYGNTETICESLNRAALSYKGKRCAYKYRHSHTGCVDDIWKDKKFPRLATIYNSAFLNCLDARMSYMHNDEFTVSLRSSMKSLGEQGYSNVLGDESPSMVCTFNLGFNSLLPWLKVANVCTKIDTYNSLRFSGLRKRFESAIDWPADRFKISDLLYTNLNFKRMLFALHNKSIKQTGGVTVICFILGDFGVNSERLEASPIQKIFESGYVHTFMPMNRFSTFPDPENLAFFRCDPFTNAYTFNRRVSNASSRFKQKIFEKLENIMDETSFIFHALPSETRAVYIESPSRRKYTFLSPAFPLRAASVVIKESINPNCYISLSPKRTTPNCRKMCISEYYVKSKPTSFLKYNSLGIYNVERNMYNIIEEKENSSSFSSLPESVISLDDDD